MAAYDLTTIIKIYQGSDGRATGALYAELGKLGQAGIVAVNLFRATKCSERAKVYRGGGYKGAAYDRKAWSINNLCAALTKDAEALGIRWGWSVDAEMKVTGDPHYHVVYCDIPTGQISFHSDVRGEGPNYSGRWDGVRGHGPSRICNWIDRLFQEHADAPAR